MKILIYDTIYSKHLFSFLKIISTYLGKSENYSEIHIILNNQFLNENHIFLDQISIDKRFHITSLPLHVENKILNTNYIFLKSIFEISYVISYSRLNKINSVLFLYIDYFQISLGVISFFSPRVNVKLYGILFESYVYRSVKSRKFWTSWLQVKFMLLNKALEKIFILNDDRIVSKLNYHNKLTIFDLLPDPVYSPNYLKLDFRILNNFSESDFIFLVLGRINPRKNVLRLVKAFENLQDEILEKSKLVVCGSFDDLNYKNILQRTASNKSKGHIFFLDTHLDDAMFDSAIFQSNCVCTVYDNFLGSSGIVGKAALANKIVLSSNIGTIGYIVDKYNLGITVDPTSVKSISEGMSKIINNGEKLSRDSKFKQYCIDNSETKFSQKIFEHINQ